jgi:hypothetical protein
MTPLRLRFWVWSSVDELEPHGECRVARMTLAKRPSWEADRRNHVPTLGIRRSSKENREPIFGNENVPVTPTDVVVHPFVNLALVLDKIEL